MRDVGTLVLTGTHGTVSDALSSGPMPGGFAGLSVGADCTGALTVVGVDNATVAIDGATGA
jgi:hypothetical protein